MTSSVLSLVVGLIGFLVIIGVSVTGAVAIMSLKYMEQVLLAGIVFILVLALLGWLFMSIAKSLQKIK